jgi:putative serine/threonine protein kinase
LNEYVPLEDALKHMVGRFLCWPQYDEEIALNRISQLKTLRVDTIAVGGSHSILGVPIRGKGHSGIVIKAIHKENEVALKIRRTDTDRHSMSREAGFLAHANVWDLGPRLYGFSDDFIVMEQIVGQYFGDWVNDNLDNKEAVKTNIMALLDIAWRLDQLGLDHGELTRIKRHFIVTEDGPRVIDFESASLERSPRNLTSTVQSLFFNYRFAQVLKKVHEMPKREILLDALKKYKREPISENYDTVLKTCNL